MGTGLPPEAVVAIGVVVALLVGVVLFKLLKMALKVAAIVTLAIIAAGGVYAWQQGWLTSASQPASQTR
jgi:uncharacterized membrane protein YebE (DUF533 family)